MLQCLKLVFIYNNDLMSSANPRQKFEACSKRKRAASFFGLWFWNVGHVLFKESLKLLSVDVTHLVLNPCHFIVVPWADTPLLTSVVYLVIVLGKGDPLLEEGVHFNGLLFFAVYHFLWWAFQIRGTAIHKVIDDNLVVAAIWWTLSILWNAGLHFFLRLLLIVTRSYF